VISIAAGGYESGAYRGAFSDSQIKSVVFPQESKLESIGDFAFYDCSQFTSITIPNVTTIGEYAFSNCSQLTSITIPDSVSISVFAFDNCPVEAVNINCQALNSNNIITTLYDIFNDRSGNNNIINIKVLRIALSASLVAQKSLTQIKEYVAGILNIPYTTNYTCEKFLNAITNNLGTFELDLSNMDLTQEDIADIPKTLPWIVIAGGERKTYAIQE
jgi:hypothetical protein